MIFPYIFCQGAFPQSDPAQPRIFCPGPKHGDSSADRCWIGISTIDPTPRKKIYRYNQHPIHEPSVKDCQSPTVVKHM